MIINDRQHCHIQLIRTHGKHPGCCPPTPRVGTSQSNPPRSGGPVASQLFISTDVLEKRCQPGEITGTAVGHEDWRSHQKGRIKYLVVVGNLREKCQNFRTSHWVTNVKERRRKNLIIFCLERSQVSNVVKERGQISPGATVDVKIPKGWVCIWIVSGVISRIRVASAVSQPYIEPQIRQNVS